MTNTFRTFSVSFPDYFFIYAAERITNSQNPSSILSEHFIWTARTLPECTVCFPNTLNRHKIWQTLSERPRMPLKSANSVTYLWKLMKSTSLSYSKSKRNDYRASVNARFGLVMLGKLTHFSFLAVRIKVLKINRFFKQELSLEMTYASKVRF